tara:strand:+ start:3649 stop:5133 length:1485 start_codon:yes stop_codon:yes gene_type:complete
MEPVDPKLYEKIKKGVWKDIPTHSAYRSGILVQKYKKAFKNKHGNKQPYVGKRPKKKGLARWFSEEWVNQRGEVGYKFKSDIYRPKRRITSNTPITHGELKNKEIKKARRIKSNKGRINRFRPSKSEKKNKNNKGKKGMKGGANKSKSKTKKKIKPKRLKNGKIMFADYPDFTPNMTPREIFKAGAFGGTYWRPIYSKVNRQKYKNRHKNYPAAWWKGIPEKHLSSSECDIKINKYGVRVGSSLQFWEDKGWIKSVHPYGWVEWYCDFYMGNRCDDDERQIKRWKNLAGPKGRFRLWLCNTIMRKGTEWHDFDLRPKFRQVLLHWGYTLTGADFKGQMKRNKVLADKYMRNKNLNNKYMRKRQNKKTIKRRKVGGKRNKTRSKRNKTRSKRNKTRSKRIKRTRSKRIKSSGCKMKFPHIFGINFKNNKKNKKKYSKKRKNKRKGKKVQKGGAGCSGANQNIPLSGIEAIDNQTIQAANDAIKYDCAAQAYASPQ